MPKLSASKQISWVSVVAVNVGCVTGLIGIMCQLDPDVIAMRSILAALIIAAVCSLVSFVARLAM